MFFFFFDCSIVQKKSHWCIFVQSKTKKKNVCKLLFVKGSFFLLSSSIIAPPPPLKNYMQRSRVVLIRVNSISIIRSQDFFLFFLSFNVPIFMKFVKFTNIQCRYYEYTPVAIIKEEATVGGLPPPHLTGEL